MRNLISDQAPPLTSHLVLGLIARPFLKKKLVQPILNKIAKNLQRRHPGLIEKLSTYAAQSILINPLDLPYTILLQINEHNIELIFCKPGTRPTYTAQISGAYLDLLELLNGNLDGDALFFSRKLTIDGTTEVVVAVRNILENEEIDPFEEILSQTGIFRQPLEFIANQHKTLVTSLQEHLDLMGSSLMNNVKQQCDQQNNSIETLQQKITLLQKQLSASEDKLSSLKKKIK